MHREIERKLLIEKPSREWLLSFAGAEESHILQTYLLAPEGVTARVRRRELAGGGVVLTHTEKRRISTLSAWENEREITESEYTALLASRDPALLPIEKTRITLPCGERLLEIDLYPFFPRTAILEVELPGEDAGFCLPEGITVIRDVTDDPRYKNVNLARALPPEETGEGHP